MLVMYSNAKPHYMSFRSKTTAYSPGGLQKGLSKVQKAHSFTHQHYWTNSYGKIMLSVVMLILKLLKKTSKCTRTSINNLRELQARQWYGINTISRLEYNCSECNSLMCVISNLVTPVFSIILELVQCHKLVHRRRQVIKSS